MSATQVPGPIETGAVLISLAGMYQLMTDAQREGESCAWCNTPLSPETAVDLGERPLVTLASSFHPIGCRPCTNKAARRDYATHPRTCLTCNRGDHCDTSQGLRRIALETRR
ncbi:hypothetical protein ACIQ6R_15930 [Streptomyces sp. NPDC096048]|uniref:hypothetical protein n=1 Tax=Streptomyces sp. NPDC096048 TaxID=3366072 RepID=UPI0038133B99